MKHVISVLALLHMKYHMQILSSVLGVDIEFLLHFSN